MAKDPSSDRVLRARELLASRFPDKQPGCAVAVAIDGRTVLREFRGIANLDYGIPIREQTVFDIGSVGKQFTAAAIVLLMDGQRIDVAADIREYVPELVRFDEPVSVYQLIVHTSGIRDVFELMEATGINAHDVFTEQKILALIAEQCSLNFEPGTKFEYSNSGYLLLAGIVRRVTGMSLGEYLREELFQPLGLLSTFIYEDRTRVVENRAIGYSVDEGGRIFVDHYYNFAAAGDGQVYSTIDDLLIWSEYLFANKPEKPNFNRIILQRGQLDDGSVIDYGFGLEFETYRGAAVIRHDGVWGGFRAVHMRLVEHALSVIVTSNLGSLNSMSIARSLADIFLQDELSP